MTPTPQQTTLRQVGEALYGSMWQSELARALGVDSRRVRQWLQDPSNRNHRPIPMGVWRDISQICTARGAALHEWSEALWPGGK